MIIYIIGIFFLIIYSIEYLVNVLGMDREEARRVITSGGSSK